MKISAASAVRIALFFLALLPMRGQAADLDGVTLPDHINIGGHSLVLNGLGIRKATIFGLHVYVAGLYLQQRDSSGEDILGNADPKYILIELKRSVSRDDIVEAWEDGLTLNVENPESYILRLNAVTEPMDDVLAGERVGILFEKDRVEMEIPGNKKFTVDGENFGNVLLSIWLGKNPPNRSLKNGLLGEGLLRTTLARAPATTNLK